MTNKSDIAVEAFYDGACPLCRREVAAYRQMTGLQDITWTDVSDPGQTADGIDRATALSRFHVRLADGRLIDGARAFLALWRRNPRLAPVMRLLDRQPFLWLLDLGYRIFLRLRPIWRRPGNS